MKPCIKICGITNLADAKLAQKLGAEFLGFVFYKQSPRYIIPAKASLIIKKLPHSFDPVGVFVNEPLTKVKRIARLCAIKILQLHGEETPEYCQALRKEGFGVIKALRIKDKNSLKQAPKFKVDALLFDTYSKSVYGGTGRIFDWKIAKGKFKLPIFLSGGISSGNVKEAIRIIRPYAIDVSSSVEKYPGRKDPKLLRVFFNALG